MRSDTATVPTPEMYQAMVTAQLGDDVFSEDPTVNALEARVAKLVGKPAALFLTTSTMSNQIAVRTHLQSPPASVLCHQNSHLFQWESSGVAYHSQAQLIPITPKDSINLKVQDVKNSFLDDDGNIHKAATKLISLENTFNGVVMPIEDIREIRKFANEKGIPVHLDGARLWNASVASGLSLAEYGKEVDSVNLCLSKGMGCPVGAVLVGSEEFIRKARYYRKLFGGAWRQAGVLAAAASYAIDHIWPTMHGTHALTKRLADGLVELGFKTELPVETNMIILDSSQAKVDMDVLAKSLGERGIVIRTVYDGSFRIVVHHQIDDKCVDEFLSVANTLASK
ncbi:Threonine aldolase [Linderina macrospora]|uniref:Threonine aldolase n=1 Tax=Linderina macrospora TaxID=4868 RepID=A0ACC1JHD4_9FUNG|nr:Threonine aldolase [Linderina macrospora]